MQKLSGFYLKITDFLLDVNYLALVFFIPVVFAFFMPAVNVFELNKIIIFRILVSSLLFLSALKIIITPFNSQLFSWSFFKRKLIVPLVFLGLISITLLFSVNEWHSFFGQYDRQNGFGNYLYYVLFFLLSLIYLSYPNQDKKIYRILGALALSSLLVSVYAVLQMMSFDFFHWNEVPYLMGRASSSLGQPNYLGSFLLLSYPIAFYLFFVDYAKRRKWLWLAVLAFNIWALLLSLSRAAWLGAFLSVIIAWLVFGKELKKITWHPKVKKHWGSLVLLIVLVLGLVAFNHSFQSRIASMFELRGGSVAVRLHYWPVALQAISERPIFGYGLENQDAAFLPYYQANWAYIGPVNSFPNRAHNFVLDILLTSGLVGLLAYALLLIFLFRQILAIKKNNRSLSFLLFLAISGYLLSLLFGFTFVSANVVLLIFGAIILMSSEKTEANYKLKPSAKIIGLIVLVLILFLVLFSWTREKSRLLADNYFWQARRSFNSQDFKAADAWFARLKSLPINTRSYDYFYLNQLYYSWNDQPGPTDLYLKAVRFYQLISYPDDASYEQAMAKAELATILGNYELAGKLWDNFIDKNPKLPEAYRLKAIMAYGAKNYQLAADLEQKTLSLLPSGPGVIGDGRSLGILQKYRAVLYRQLGDAYMGLGQSALARDNYKQSLSLDFDLILYKKISNTYFIEKNYDQAIWYVNRAMFLDKGNYIWPYALAILHRDLKKYSEASEYCHKALELAPENQELLNLQNELQTLNSSKK